MGLTLSAESSIVAAGKVFHSRMIPRRTETDSVLSTRIHYWPVKRFKYRDNMIVINQLKG